MPRHAPLTAAILLALPLFAQADEREDLELAAAEGAYEIAKEQCDALTGEAKDACMDEAEAAYEAAKDAAQQRQEAGEDMLDAAEEAADDMEDAIENEY